MRLCRMRLCRLLVRGAICVRLASFGLGHARNEALVLDRSIALVSPQFHVAFDPAFDTAKEITTKSMWQTKAGFVAQREPSTSMPK